MTDSQAHLRIVRVDVEDGSVDDPANVSAVRAGAGVAGVSREPDLGLDQISQTEDNTD